MKDIFTERVPLSYACYGTFHLVRWCFLYFSKSPIFCMEWGQERNGTERKGTDSISL